VLVRLFAARPIGGAAQVVAPTVVQTLFSSGKMKPRPHEAALQAV